MKMTQLDMSAIDIVSIEQKDNNLEMGMSDGSMIVLYNVGVKFYSAELRRAILQSKIDEAAAQKASAEAAIIAAELKIAENTSVLNDFDYVYLGTGTESTSTEV